MIRQDTKIVSLQDTHYHFTIYEVWLKRNRTVRAGHKLDDQQTSETCGINLYHIAVLRAKRHVVNAVLLLSRAVCLIDI